MPSLLDFLHSWGFHMDIQWNLIISMLYFPHPCLPSDLPTCLLYKFMSFFVFVFDDSLSPVSNAYMCMEVGPSTGTQETSQWSHPPNKWLFLLPATVNYQQLLSKRVGLEMIYLEIIQTELLSAWSCAGNYSSCGFFFLCVCVIVMPCPEGSISQFSSPFSGS